MTRRGPRTHHALAWLGLGVALGCSSGSDAGNGTPPAGAYACPPSGAAVAESAACDDLRAALAERAKSLSCTVTLPTCPDFLRGLTPDDACRDWSRGSIDACSAYVAAYATCDDFTGKPVLPAYEPTRTWCGDAGP